MLHPRSSAAALAALVAGLVLASCGGGESPSPAPPPRPAQPAVAKLPPPPVVPPAPTTEYAYETKNRRDPFRPLITPKVPVTTATRVRPKTGLGSLEVHELKLAGIVWEARGYYALVEAPNGAGYVLRVNDVIGDEARVRTITPEAVTVELRGPAPAGPARQESRLVQIRLRKEE